MRRTRRLRAKVVAGAKKKRLSPLVGEYFLNAADQARLESNLDPMRVRRRIRQYVAHKPFGSFPAPLVFLENYRDLEPRVNIASVSSVHFCLLSVSNPPLARSIA